MTLESTRAVTEMRTSNISWEYRRPKCTAENLTNFLCRLSIKRGVSTSWNPQSLSRPVWGLLYLLPLLCLLQISCRLLCVRNYRTSNDPAILMKILERHSSFVYVIVFYLCLVLLNTCEICTLKSRTSN